MKLHFHFHHVAEILGKSAEQVLSLPSYEIYSSVNNSKTNKINQFQL